MEKELGKEGKLKAEIVGGKIKLSVEYDGKQLDGGAYIMTDSDLLIDAIVGLLPEKLQQNALVIGLVGVLKATLKGVIV